MILIFQRFLSNLSHSLYFGRISKCYFQPTALVSRAWRTTQRAPLWFPTSPFNGDLLAIVLHSSTATEKITWPRPTVQRLSTKFGLKVYGRSSLISDFTLLSYCGYEVSSVSETLYRMMGPSPSQTTKKAHRDEYIWQHKTMVIPCRCRRLLWFNNSFTNHLPISYNPIHYFSMTPFFIVLLPKALFARHSATSTVTVLSSVSLQTSILNASLPGALTAKLHSMPLSPSLFRFLVMSCRPPTSALWFVYFGSHRLSSSIVD